MSANSNHSPAQIFPFINKNPAQDASWAGLGITLRQQIVEEERAQHSPNSCHDSVLSSRAASLTESSNADREKGDKDEHDADDAHCFSTGSGS